jgi:excisionase family DNA binding protein
VQEGTVNNISEQQWIPEYISVGFVAKRCGVSNTTVLRWIGAGQLSAFRLPGGHYRIHNQDFSDFMFKFSMPIHEIGNKKDKPKIT